MPVLFALCVNIAPGNSGLQFIWEESSVICESSENKTF